jgi:hypothetical protein
LTAIEQDKATCLPVEAYIKLMRLCGEPGNLKIRSSVYPTKQSTKEHNGQNTTNTKHPLRIKHDTRTKGSLSKHEESLHTPSFNLG